MIFDNTDFTYNTHDITLDSSQYQLMKLHNGIVLWIKDLQPKTYYIDIHNKDTFEKVRLKVINVKSFETKQELIDFIYNDIESGMFLNMSTLGSCSDTGQFSVVTLGQPTWFDKLFV